MSCSLLLCFVGVFAEGSVEVLGREGVAYTPARQDVPRQYRDRQVLQNPYAQAALGARWSTPGERFQVDLLVGHRSSLFERDHGENYIAARGTVWLWRANR